MSPELELALQVRDNLTATRRDFTHVAVIVQNGEVRLVGCVRSYHLRQVAVERTKRLPGVRQVIDEIQVTSEGRSSMVSPIATPRTAPSGWHFSATPVAGEPPETIDR